MGKDKAIPEADPPRPHTATLKLTEGGHTKKLSTVSVGGIKKIKVLKQPLKKHSNGMMNPPVKVEEQAPDLSANSRQLKISYLERESSN